MASNRARELAEHLAQQKTQLNSARGYVSSALGSLNGLGLTREVAQLQALVDKVEAEFERKDRMHKAAVADALRIEALTPPAKVIGFPTHGLHEFVPHAGMSYPACNDVCNTCGFSPHGGLHR